MHNIGNIALNISVATYLLYFLPQLIHNARRGKTKHLSWGLHLLYICGMSCDLVYGFGNNLAIQYRLVTIVGLLCLVIQHLQLCRHKEDGLAASTIAIILYSAAILCVSLHLKLSNHSYNLIGLASQFCWWTAFIPQIIKNYQTKNAEALATGFIALTLSCSILDLIAAISLGWPYPSIISPPIMILLHSTCWLQKIYYRNKPSLAQSMPAN